MENFKFSIIAALIFAICPANGSNILFVIPYPTPSHFQCFHSLMIELAERGHNLTVVSPFDPNHKNITFVDLTGAKKYFHASWTSLRSETRLQNMITTYEIVKNFMNKALYDDNFQQLLHNNETHFDLLMIEIYYADAYLALAEKYNAPVIGLVPQTLPAVYGWLTNNPISFSYIPNMYLPYTNDMNFFQRLTNSLFGIVHVAAYEIWYYVANQEIVNRHFDFLQSTQKNLKNMLNDISLLLVNTHYTMGYPRPFLPNVIEVAGMHMKLTKPLPQDIKKFMDESVNGVVYISFGTMVDPSVVEKWGDVILQVFANQPLRVVWKWNASMVEDIPRNFLLQTWLPQNEILQHRNCKLFITHGGVHSLIETINAGVPIIGVPFFSDQPLNIANAEKMGMGIGLKDLETDPLKDAVRRIFQNPDYHKNARHRSKLFKDRLVDPLSTATYWVEHVIRNKGAPHLKSGAAKLTWYQYFMLDVIVFVFVTVILTFFLLALISTYTIRFAKRKLNSFVALVIRHNYYRGKKIQ